MSKKVPKTKRIRPALPLSTAADSDIVSLGQSAVKGLLGNAAFSTSPVDINVLKTDVGNLSAAISAALDGGKKAIAERHRLREIVVKELRLLGHYVEAASNNDLPTLLSSGFRAATPVVRVPPQPLPPAGVRKIDQGNSGQLMVWLTPVPRSYSYELRFAQVGAGGIPGAWTTIPIVAVQTSTTINSLTPGTTYVFQARALGRLGFSDWSDSFTKMST